MADLVAAVGVPHSPQYPALFPKDGPHVTSQHYREIKAQLDECKPDVIVSITNDHFNTFFLNNFPSFAIGVAASSSGPNDDTRMPHYEFAVHTELASHIHSYGVKEGFDFSVTQEFDVDHAMLVPLHFLTDGVQVPVVPIWVNALLRPLPTAQRCYALGQMLKAAIHSLPNQLRVAIVASGHFSLEISGPRADPGERNGTPDIAWSKHVHRRIKNGEVNELLKEATSERMWRAGNIGGELLNWIVLLGVVEGSTPHHLTEHDEKVGHTFAIWRRS